MTYPDTWPKRNAQKPWTLSSRITDQEKTDLYNGKITAKELAITYNTHEKYVAGMFPGRAPKKKPIPKSEMPLTLARVEFRMAICVDVLNGKYTVMAASKICSCSYNTMQRWLAKAKAQNPDLVPAYNERLTDYRKNFNKNATTI